MIYVKQYDLQQEGQNVTHKLKVILQALNTIIALSWISIVI